MDFPIFHLDFFGNRMLIAVIASLHVIINHSMAVGALPLITTMEWWGWRTGEERWDRLAHRYLKVTFIITTTVGALTGVGIWFSASLVNPYAIGSLIRVFFWAWFFEWIVFVTEVVLILVYYLLWNRWQGQKKRLHILTGIALSFASFMTMAVIVGILGYMMDPGAWREARTLLTGFFNPIYFPQLVFRIPMAMLMAGVLALFLNLFMTEKGSEWRYRATRWVSRWMLVWLPAFLAGALWYRSVIPEFMANHLPVALGTMRFEALYDQLLYFTFACFALIVLVSLWGAVKPATLPAWSWIVAAVLVIVLTGQFERAREFIRKPYVLGGYIYANGIRVSDYPLLMQEGVLAHASYVSQAEVTPGNKKETGRALFRIACSRCHTMNGINSIRSNLERMYGMETVWSAEAIDRYLTTMYSARTFMPPFPGNEEERVALADYLVGLQSGADILEGAQTVGTPVKAQ